MQEVWGVDMTLFAAYRQADRPSLRLYAPYWLPSIREAHVPLGGKAAMLKAARRGWRRGVQSRRVVRMLQDDQR